jgi:hypothetical protein
MKEEKMMQYRDSDVGRMSNVEDVLSALKDDDAEYLAMLKVREIERERERAGGDICTPLPALYASLYG